MKLFVWGIPVPPSRFYRFGCFRLDPSNRLLFHGEAVVPLTLKAFDTLLVLVENHGAVVTKETLLKKIWPETFVDDNSIAQNISLLRKLFADADGGTEYIATVPKRGYRFLARVEEIGDQQPDELPRGALPAHSSGATAGRGRLAFWRVLAFLAVVVLSVAASVGLYARFWHRRVPSPTRATLVVLPFVNLIGDAGQDYVADGLTEEMIAQISRMNPQKLAVIARTSSMAYRQTNKTVDQIGRELGVNYVLEGSVRGTAGRMRFTVQLIRVRDQTHLWTRTFDRTAADVLEAQGDVSRAVAQEVELAVTPQSLPSARAVPDPEVYDLYLQGRFYWNKRTREGLAKGIEYFRQAIARDSRYAPAYAGLADCLFLQRWISELPGEQVIPSAQEAARRAIDLDPSLAEPHASLGIIAVAEMHWAEAENEFQRALELNANYATAHHWNGLRLGAIGKTGDGVSEIRRAIELDPLAPILHTDMGWLLILDRKPELAVVAAKKALELDPGFYLAYEYLARAHEQQRDYETAIAEMKKAVDLSGGKPELRARLGRVYALAGQTSEATRIQAELKKESKHKPLSSMLAALVYSGLGEYPKELTMLERAFTESYNTETSWLKVDPTYDTVREDPRFQKLLHKYAATQDPVPPPRSNSSPRQ